MTIMKYEIQQKNTVPKIIQLANCLSTVMVSTSLVVAIIGVGGTIIASAIGSYVNLRTTKINQKYKNNRTVAEFYMEEKINHLIDLYTVNEKVSGGLVEFALRSRDDASFSVDKRKFIEFKETIEEYDRLGGKCQIFLNREQFNTFVNASILCKTVIQHTYEDDGEYKIDWDEVENDSYVVQNNTELDAFRKHTRQVKEMLDSEVNEPINEIY